MREFWIVLAAIALAARAQDQELAERIRAILQERIDAEKTVGIVAGVLDEKGATVAGAGRTGKNLGAEPVDGDTVYEVGSISNVFTAVLLASVVHDGKARLDDAAQWEKMPSRDGKQITLRHLAQHTSGLPRLPDNFVPKDSRNPYADYEPKHLAEFLAAYKLPRTPGEKFEYSNLAYGLLGLILERDAYTGDAHGGGLQKRLLEPLGMKRTWVLAPYSNKDWKEADGHDDLLREVPDWSFFCLGSAGAYRSTANDLLKFAAANLQSRTSPQTAALKMALEAPRIETGQPGLQVALGWFVLKTPSGEIYWHSGGTGGYRSWLGLDRKTRRAAVVLSNSSASIDDIGQHLLDPSFQLVPQKKAVKVPLATLDTYTGEYPLGMGLSIVITREGEALVGQATGQPKFVMKPTSQTTFSVDEVEAVVSFALADGAMQLTLKQSGQTLKGKRRDTGKAPSPPPAAEPERKAITVDAKTLQRYTGVYQLDPNFTITVTRDGQQLFAQATGQAKYEILPESTTKFFYTVTNAQITFQKIEGEKANELILHQQGQNYPASRRKD